MIKRILGGALAAISMFVSVTMLPVSAAKYELAAPSGYVSPFKDLQKDDWYYEFVSTLNSAGMIDGYGDGYFGANDPLTAGAALVMVLKAAGTGDIAPVDSHYASGYAKYAIEHGYLTKEQIGDLDEPMERVLVAHLAVKALDLELSTEKSPFADIDDPYLTTLYEIGIVTGSEQDGKLVFLPEQSITRAEISVIVWQVDRVHRFGKQIAFMGDYYDILQDVPVNAYLPQDFQKKDGRIYYEKDGKKAVAGIDVSVHQGSIDWQKVKDSGIEFAMLRVGYRGYGSEGKIMPDKYFEENIQGAYSVGMDVGIYFFSQSVTEAEARQEAAYVIEQIEPYRQYITYPVVYDWEHQNYAGSRTQKIPNVDMMTTMIHAFCQEIEDAGYQPMVYFYQNLAYNNLDLSQVTEYPFWLAQYTDYPSFYYNFDMWQYTSSGKIPGISGAVDLNLYFTPEKIQISPPKQEGEQEEQEIEEDIPYWVPVNHSKQ